MSIKEKYVSLKEVHFERIKKKHLDLIKSFQTWQQELRDFLVEDAIRNQELCVSSTYLLFNKNDFKRNRKKTNNLTLLGYVTISNDRINLNKVLREFFQKKGINYRSLPSIKIGRLCVDNRYKKLGLGKIMMVECIRRSCYLNLNTACRFITLDAKRHIDKTKDSLYFYKMFGFEVLDHKNKSKSELINKKTGVIPMYLDIYPILSGALKIKTVT